MKAKLLLRGLKDLLNVLPGHNRREWSELGAIDAKRPTVILVSGFGANSRNLSVIRKRLRRDGFNVLILSLNWQMLSDSVRGFYHLAERLSSVVLELKKRPGMRHSKVVLVAHSAGGLVARYYVQALGGSHYCEGLITLGTPHAGTWRAALGFFSPLVLKIRCLFQMLPISPFVRHVNELDFPRGFKMMSIFSKDDFVCTKRSTILPAILNGEGDILVKELSGLSHGSFLTSKRCYAILKDYMRTELEIPIHEPVATDSAQTPTFNP